MGNWTDNNFFNIPFQADEIRIWALIGMFGGLSCLLLSIEYAIKHVITIEKYVEIFWFLVCAIFCTLLAVHDIPKN